MAAGNFSRLVLSHWRELHLRLESYDETVLIDGHGLSLASVIASARYGQDAAITDRALECSSHSAEQAMRISQDVTSPYGKKRHAVPAGLHCGILSGDIGFENSNISSTFSSAIPLDDPVESTSMPESWVRASMLIRLNSFAHGTSGVRPIIMERLLQLLNLDIVPRIPLRGSVSGFGDPSPLSYVGGTMQGKPAVQAWVGDRIQGGRRLVPGDEALHYAELKTIDIRASEGLAIVHGTAISAGVASLALHEAISLASVAIVLTAMSVEALSGTEESFHSFFSHVRPHPGQAESAANVQGFLEGSRLTVESANLVGTSGQDRSAIRTAPQWIGPVLEDLLLAHSQIVVDINSATENPLIEPSGKTVHGGNFQAQTITSAIEKVRQSCQSLGQMIFSQCGELMDPATSKGLSPNLSVDEPSRSSMWQGTDILIAALQSELGFLSSPVRSHVQSAAMGTQAINSLALISGRYTLTAVDVLAQLAAAHLVVLCQALDLRALHIQFLYALAPKFKALTRRCLSECLEAVSPNSDGCGAETAYNLWVKLSEHINRSTQMDSTLRYSTAMDHLQTQLLRAVPASQRALEAVQRWNTDCVNEALETDKVVKARYLSGPDATPVLGTAARRMYTYVRRTLEIPFFGEEYMRLAEWDDSTSASSRHKYKSVGAMISAVYEAMRNGSLYSEVVECFEEI
ncbi:phenylalanine ammonia-lyase-like protein [Pleomassaria siparia CBS 279.74]|uniref:Phenylalanine ammonia-lyase-like protein n=1 Tax=Pleomassaria siparia CBS 279.74 TaxID=1314801 RepID=A0A6G1JYE4_9PLEO|nr:phenylalanine ammonia-lyase-like protein [Pleomassaria siparia CBS 279.74]